MDNKTSVNLYTTVRNKPVFFLICFFIVFTVSFGALYIFDLVPSEFGVGGTDEDISPIFSGETPTKIVIDKIGVDSIILNPATKKVGELDKFLKQGVVRYPDSGLLGKGNMFLFGHSADAYVVTNPAYKAFNKLGELKHGDIIRVRSTTKEYTYIVRTVVLIDENKALVDFTKKEPMLTISTCNTFGKRQERFVVEADFVSSRSV